MNIKVSLVDDANFTYMTGGGCAAVDCYVNIDAKLDDYHKQETLIHEILEAYLWMFDHSKIDELTDALMNGMEQLK